MITTICHAMITNYNLKKNAERRVNSHIKTKEGTVDKHQSSVITVIKKMFFVSVAMLDQNETFWFLTGSAISLFSGIKYKFINTNFLTQKNRSKG